MNILKNIIQNIIIYKYALLIYTQQERTFAMLNKNSIASCEGVFIPPFRFPQISDYENSYFRVHIQPGDPLTIYSQILSRQDKSALINNYRQLIYHDSLTSLDIFNTLEVIQCTFELDPVFLIWFLHTCG